MGEIKFSVIIPCYNGVKYIEECLVSISNQSFQDFEVILVDDNSTDGSFELACRLKEELLLRGKILKKPSDLKKGVSASRNIAVNAARGTWLVFLDCDDYFLNDKLKVIDHFISENQEAHAIHHAYDKFDNETGESRMIHMGNLPRHDLDFLMEDNPICTSTVTVKKSVLLETGGFNEKLQGVEDYYLWCRIANNYGPWHYLPDVLTKYRHLTDSLMSRRRLSYYVGQVEGLYREAIASGEFTSAQLKNIHKKFFFNQLNYRIDISLNYFGIGDFLNGLFLLIKTGKTSAAIHHLKTRTKNYALLTRFNFLKKNPNSTSL